MIVEPGQEFPSLGEADVCIVGAGAAGITLALELARSGLQVITLQEGGPTPRTNDRSVYQVLPGPRVSLGVDERRQLFLGGNTNHWFGNCRPLDDADFQPRPWIPH
ncbi:MAG TPA: FAD-dependent oxidoreductase, partial [Acidimicrobiia bacterium]|nr:FAD-dependent oxidoreductase [Acidimicrobiia bacterium]